MPSRCLTRSVFNVDSSTGQFIILSDQLILFMCIPTHLNVVSGFQCDVKTHHRQQVLLSFRPYLLRELMNFSLARLLTSFEAPSSGLDHLFTPVAGVCCSPERKQAEFLVHGKISSRKYCQINLVILPILESQSRRAQRTICSTCRVQTRHGNCFSIVDGQSRHISKQSAIHYSLHL